MEFEIWLPSSHQPAIRPYPNLQEFSPCHTILFLWSTLILSFHLSLGLTSDFPSPSTIKNLCTCIACPSYVPHGPSISFFLIWSFEEWKLGAGHYSIFSGLLLLSTSYTSPVSLSIFKYNHLLPRLSSTTIIKIPTLSLAIHTSSGLLHRIIYWNITVTICISLCNCTQILIKF